MKTCTDTICWKTNYVSSRKAEWRRMSGLNSQINQCFPNRGAETCWYVITRRGIPGIPFLQLLKEKIEKITNHFWFFWTIYKKNVLIPKQSALALFMGFKWQVHLRNKFEDPWNNQSQSNEYHFFQYCSLLLLKITAIPSHFKISRSVASVNGFDSLCFMFKLLSFALKENPLLYFFGCSYIYITLYITDTFWTCEWFEWGFGLQFSLFFQWTSHR